MSATSPKPAAESRAPSIATSVAQPSSAWERVPWAPMLAAICLLSWLVVPRVAENPRLVATFVGVSGALLLWSAILWIRGRATGRAFRITYTPVSSHYVQASVQLCVYLYWGWYWPNVYAQAPLILAQIVYLYALDALLTWSRGRDWRIGFGPLPIIFSTNLFMWFRDDWFYLQFLMVATGALGKQFIQWKRDGKLTHIFNPSAFGLGVFAIFLIATNSTHITWGLEIATTMINAPHIYVEIFLVGLVVQYFFNVTLMTLSAAAALYVMNLVYTETTGVYQFLDTNIPIAVFLGLHLLMTDPSTSPRTNTGRVIFGALYGAANFVLYDVLAKMGAPEFYDKLLPVPILNLLVPVIERVSRIGFLGRFTQWEGRFPVRKLNLVHMSCWIALFLTMLFSGFVQAPHPGESTAFWKRAYKEGRHHADWKYLKIVQASAANGSGAASTELGILYMEGVAVPKDTAAAAHYFSRGCELGDKDGCANVVRQFLFLRAARSDADVERALAVMETESGKGTDARSAYLVGYAYEMGFGRPQDRARALDLYERACKLGNAEACAARARVH